jgi:F0F1-type ATP synthase membrane subunit b/b'
MVRKKVAIAKNQVSKNIDISESKTILEEKIIYSIANTSVILMSTMMGAFTQVLGSTIGAMASGMAEAMGGKEASDKVDQEIKKEQPELDAKMKSVISDIRKDIYSQMKEKKQELEQILSDPTFQVGPKIIEKYDFNLPNLTQELDDNTLSKYSQLLVNEDERFGKMFKELTEWVSSLPKPT